MDRLNDVELSQLFSMLSVYDLVAFQRINKTWHRILTKESLPRRFMRSNPHAAKRFAGPEAKTRAFLDALKNSPITGPLEDRFSFHIDFFKNDEKLDIEDTSSSLHFKITGRDHKILKAEYPYPTKIRARITIFFRRYRCERLRTIWLELTPTPISGDVSFVHFRSRREVLPGKHMVLEQAIHGAYYSMGEYREVNNLPKEIQDGEEFMMDAGWEIVLENISKEELVKLFD